MSGCPPIIRLTVHGSSRGWCVAKSSFLSGRVAAGARPAAQRAAHARLLSCTLLQFCCMWGGCRNQGQEPPTVCANQAWHVWQQACPEPRPEPKPAALPATQWGIGTPGPGSTCASLQQHYSPCVRGGRLGLGGSQAWHRPQASVRMSGRQGVAHLVSAEGVCVHRRCSVRVVVEVGAWPLGECGERGAGKRAYIGRGAVRRRDPQP